MTPHDPSNMETAVGIIVLLLFFPLYYLLLFKGIPWVWKWSTLLTAILMGRADKLKELDEDEICPKKKEGSWWSRLWSLDDWDRYDQRTNPNTRYRRHRHWNDKDIWKNF